MVVRALAEKAGLCSKVEFAVLELVARFATKRAPVFLLVAMGSLQLLLSVAVVRPAFDARPVVIVRK